MLLAAGGSYFFEPFVPKAGWVRIIYARQELRAKKIIIEGDSITVIIGWIRNGTKNLKIHPILRDI